jgi:hypothetical protein
MWRPQRFIAGPWSKPRVGCSRLNVPPALVLVRATGRAIRYSDLPLEEYSAVLKKAHSPAAVSQLVAYLLADNTATPDDKHNFTLLLAEFRAQLNSARWPERFGCRPCDSCAGQPTRNFSDDVRATAAAGIGHPRSLGKSNGSPSAGLGVSYAPL